MAGGSRVEDDKFRLNKGDMIQEGGERRIENYECNTKMLYISSWSYFVANFAILRILLNLIIPRYLQNNLSVFTGA